MAILNRIRAALNPNIELEDLEGDTVATPFKDLGEYFAAGFGVQTRKAKERRAQLEAERDLELGMIDGRIGSQLEDLLAMDTESGEHRAVVSGLADRAAIVSRQLASPFADMREAGVAELAQLNQDIHAAGLKVEERAIRDAELEAAGLKEDFDGFNLLYDDLYRESSDFIERRDSYNALRQSYAQGIGEDVAGNANDIAAINSLQRMIDPGVSVREGDVSILQNLAGVPDLLVTAANRVANEGARFTPEQRLEVLRLGNDLIAGANEEQTKRNARFQQTAGVAQIDQSFIGQLSIPTTELRDLPGMEGRTGDPVTRPRRSEPDEPAARETGRLLGETAASGGETLRQGLKGLVEGALGVDVIDGRVYSGGSVTAARARLEQRLDDPDLTDEESRQIRMELNVLDAAQGIPRRRGIIVRPTN